MNAANLQWRHNSGEVRGENGQQIGPMPMSESHRASSVQHTWALIRSKGVFEGETRP